MSTDLHDRTSPPSPDEGPDKHERPKSSLSIAQVVGGALAAMTAAALGSRLSVAGTVVGAAFASVIAAVAGALYTSSLRRTSKHVSTVLARVRPTNPSQPDAVDAASAPARTADAGTDASWVLPTAPADGAGSAAGSAPRRKTGWKPVLAGAVLIFAITALALTGIELVTGHALSGGTGTTVGRVADPPTRSSPTPTRRATPTPTATPSATARPTTGAEPGATASAAPSSRPTAEPTATGSGTPAPSATPTSTPTSAPSAPAGSADATPAS